SGLRLAQVYGFADQSGGESKVSELRLPCCCRAPIRCRHQRLSARVWATLEEQVSMLKARGFCSLRMTRGSLGFHPPCRTLSAWRPHTYPTCLRLWMRLPANYKSTSCPPTS